MLFAYFGTLAWQPIWLGLIPPPSGPGVFWLAAVACVPLLLPLVGILQLRHRSLIWGGLILLVYFVIGITEAWSNPPQRLPALVQVALPIIYLLAFRQRTRSEPAKP